MKYVTLILSTFLLIYGVHAQKRTYINIENDTVKKAKFFKQIKESSAYSVWIYQDAEQNTYERMIERYLIGHGSYEEIRNEIEKITGNQIGDSTSIIIEYRFLDDFCNSRNRDNNWSKSEIAQRKSFIKPIKKHLNNLGLYYIALFENGITLNNRPDREKEYFFSDKNDYFRQKLFVIPALCGSFAAIKPNGEILIRNGEFRADSFAKYLLSKNWNQFFNPN
jgi:hypothetical protein